MLELKIDKGKINPLKVNGDFAEITADYLTVGLALGRIIKEHEKGLEKEFIKFVKEGIKDIAEMLDVDEEEKEGLKEHIKMFMSL